MELLKLTILILSISWVSSSHTAVRKRDPAIKKYDSLILELQNEIGKIEKDLGKRNKAYIKHQKKKLELDKKLEELRADLQESHDKLLNSYNKSRKILLGLVVNNLNDDSSVSNLVSKKVLEENTKYELSNLEDKIEDNKLKRENLASLEEDYNLLVKNKNSLAIILNELEKEKNRKSHQFMRTIREKDTYSARIKKATKSVKVPKVSKVKIRFTPPITQYVEHSNKKKGITFKYRKSTELIAPHDGRVSYFGNLSTYGKILMIDHGNEVRSIILGPIRTGLTKGVEVKGGSIIGHTLDYSTKKNLGQVYFEVRKKDIAQNTLSLMKSSFLARLK